MADQVVPSISTLDSSVPPMSIPIKLVTSEIASIDSNVATSGSQTIFELPQRPGVSINPQACYMTFLLDLPQAQSLDGTCESLIDSVRIETSAGQTIEECRAYGATSHMIWKGCADSGCHSHNIISQGGISDDPIFTEANSTDGKRRYVVTFNELGFMSMNRSFPLFALPGGIRIIIRWVPNANDAIFASSGTASFAISETRLFVEELHNTPEYVDSVLKNIVSSGINFVYQCWSNSVIPITGTSNGGMRVSSNIRDPQAVMCAIRLNSDRSITKKYMTTTRQSTITRLGFSVDGERFPSSEIRCDSANQDVTDAYSRLMRAYSRTGMTTTGTLFDPLQYSFATKTMSFIVTAVGTEALALVTISTDAAKWLVKYMGNNCNTGISIPVTGNGFITNDTMNVAMVITAINISTGVCTTATTNAASSSAVSGTVGDTTLIITAANLNSGKGVIYGELLSPTAHSVDTESFISSGPKKSIDVNYQSDVMSASQLYTHVLHKRVMIIKEDGVSCE